jgi:FkbM family methyltransferase
MNPEHIVAQLILRSWPFGRGKSKILNTFFPKVTFQEALPHVKTTDGASMQIASNDWIGRHLYLTGEYERSVLDVLFSLARPNDVLLDVGANIGYISASFLHRIPGSEVIAVEPQTGIVGMLLGNNLRRYPDRYHIFPFALSEASGRASFLVSDGNLGDGRLVETGDYEITTRRGDDVLAKTEKIDLVKIDVQGHELHVLRSMQSTLERLKPRAILFEDDENQLSDIAALLQELGYVVRGIRKTMIKSFRVCDLDEIRTGIDNFIATR